MRSSPPPCPVQIFRDTQYLNSLSVSSVFGSGCLRHAEVIGPHYSPPHFLKNNAPRPRAGWGAGRDGAGGGAARGSVCRCQCVCPSLLHCLPPPLLLLLLPLPESPQLPASRVAATFSDRWEATQVGQEEQGGLREPRWSPHWGLPPQPELAGRKHVPAGGASCLSVRKHPLDPINLPYAAYPCLGVRTRHSPHLLARWDPGTASGWAPAMRWEVAVHIVSCVAPPDAFPGEAGVEALS